MATINLHDLSAYDFWLPPELIAQYPASEREGSRLLVAAKDGSALKDCSFSDIADFFCPGDALVINETRVIPARLQGFKATGGSAEILLLKPLANGWEALVRPARRLPPGTVVYFAATEVKILVQEELPLPGGRLVRFLDCPDPEAFIDEFGRMPLPPYISRPSGQLDRERYQTVYARVAGSAAAPTAGLHFTDEILRRLRDKGVDLIKIVLHVGLGTFRPVAGADIRTHVMHSEHYEVSGEAARSIQAVRRGRGRIIAVGTTVVRTLETIAELDPDGSMADGGYQGETGIFIYPGYSFKSIDALITNFHLPRSSLLMLVAAFAGYDTTMAAYRHAVAASYRFFSYGDVMFIC